MEKVLSAAQRAQWWKENREEQAKAGDPAGSSTYKAAAGQTANGEDADDDPDSRDDNLWERWANVIDMYADHSLILVECYNCLGIKEKSAMPAEAGARNTPFPRGPRRRGLRREHRDKHTKPGSRGSCDAMVASPVGRAEVLTKPAATQAMNHEWTRLRNTNVWDENHPREWCDGKNRGEGQRVLCAPGALGRYLCGEELIDRARAQEVQRSRCVLRQLCCGPVP